MIYHFLSQNMYADQFLDFMRKNKDLICCEHLFLFKNNGIVTGVNKNNSFSSDDSKKIFSFFDFLKIFLFLKRNDRIIFHSYSHPYLYFVAACCWWNLHKITWIIWGGDLYWYNTTKTGKYKIYEIFRRFTIKRFGYILSDQFEYRLAKRFYATAAKNIFADYPRKFFQFITDNIHDYTAILIGNSRDPSNEHIEALQLISRYKEENIKVYVILSYGDCPLGYVENIDRIGKSLFGEKYIAIKHMMDLKAYQEFLSTIDVMVCNHRRQQAWGNLLAILKYGKKVFIRSGISTEEDFNEYGLKFFLTDDIETMSFTDFKAFSENDKYRNENIITKMYSNETLLSKWNHVFTTIERNI